MIKQKYNYLLIGCVLVLAVICFLSVSGPLAFERERAERAIFEPRFQSSVSVL